MCRHLAYVGPACALGEVLTRPEFCLVRQSWAPRRQGHGTVNADGFGVGWYAEGDPLPARYRRTGPVWADASFADLCRVVRSAAFLAAVRDATDGCAGGEAAVAPFTAGRWLFSHNGAVTGWPASVSEVAARALSARELLEVEARTDSALAWALVRHRLRDGAAPARALSRVAVQLAGAAPGSRLNFLLTNGRTVAGTAAGESLWYLHRPGASLTVASEPHDADPGWRQVPERHVLAGDAAHVELILLEEL
ncbi:ergothioneine biosynthesis protein EgtC [Streptomyces albus subsp. chlorinus]|uniref:ergothioneine biosynthesis protein EgtC n=1 Tax=Streptomyces albus TaxID=1888 RepID=UPI00156F3B52|nr:ergothioneine biosynthesis protein EgtC [Streptomyces albus]NSC25268.1 ergothioneine biosynthesis protein EgtC [Streptomyces albus subsp. chlorinus]